MNIFYNLGAWYSPAGVVVAPTCAPVFPALNASLPDFFSRTSIPIITTQEIIPTSMMAPKMKNDSFAKPDVLDSLNSIYPLLCPEFCPDLNLVCPTSTSDIMDAL